MARTGPRRRPRRGRAGPGRPGRGCRPRLRPRRGARARGRARPRGRDPRPARPAQLRRGSAPPGPAGGGQGAESALGVPHRRGAHRVRAPRPRARGKTKRATGSPSFRSSPPAGARSRPTASRASPLGEPRQGARGKPRRLAHQRHRRGAVAAYRVANGERDARFNSGRKRREAPEPSASSEVTPWARRHRSAGVRDQPHANARRRAGRRCGCRRIAVRGHRRAGCAYSDRRSRALRGRKRLSEPAEPNGRRAVSRCATSRRASFGTGSRALGQVVLQPRKKCP